MAQFEVVDSVTVRDADGRKHSVLDAIGALPWVPQVCPQMPHEYAVFFKSPEWAWRALDTMGSSRMPAGSFCL